MFRGLRRIAFWMLVLGGIGVAYTVWRRRGNETASAEPSWPPLRTDEPAAATSSSTDEPAAATSSISSTDEPAAATDSGSGQPAATSSSSTDEPAAATSSTSSTDEPAAATDSGSGQPAAATSSGEPATDAAPTATRAPKARAATGDPAIVNALAGEVVPRRRWVDPVDGECPPGYPVKANDNSGIYHAPGGRFYERTRPERCYATTDDAEADGYRAAKA